MPEPACPCGLPEPYARCCGRFHGGAEPPTAELLMRARYAAFVTEDLAYLRATWDPATRPRRVRPDPDVRWTGLEIVGRTGGGLLESHATVEFRAHHAGGTVHENSRFRRTGGRWLYVGPM